MMKYIYSILTLRNKKGDECVVVCETMQDEKDVIRHADHAGIEVRNVVPAEDARPIYLNDFEL